jgi:Flp pilus assembly protein TadB
MSNAEPDPGYVQRAPFWIRELPYSVAFILTILGVAYTTFTKHPVMGYWALLAPVIGVVCVCAGWRNACDWDGRMRLIWTQALHWFAFLVAMSLMFVPDIQRILNANATGLAIMTLLALGTFTAGVHVPSWQICLLGLVMALAVPAIAWIEESALIYVLLTVMAFGLGIVYWWNSHERRTRKTHHPARAA